jgi:hypothetical protein
MKNMTFIFRGLMKTSFLLVLLFAAQDGFAQSLNTQASFINNSSVVKGDSPLANANLVNSAQAIENLNTEAALINNATPADDYQQNNDAIKMQYYKYLAGQIQIGNSVHDALSNSGTVLSQLFNSKADIVDVTSNDVFLAALDLVSN